MLAAYGIDVLDPEVSTRRVHVLLERLPPAARRGGEHWSTEAELLASLIDHVAQLTYVTLKAAGAKTVTKPTPVKRPPSRGQAVAPRPANYSSSPDAPAKASSWGEGLGALSQVQGVEVKHG
jgi:hypothetical protein